MATYDARPSAFTQLTTTADWEALLGAFMPQGGAVDNSITNSLTPTLDTPGRNAVMAPGQAIIKGQLWRCDTSVNTTIPAASAQNRIDRLVLRLTRGASTSATVVAPAVITGTPSGSPVAPALTQTPTGIWELPIGRWTATSAGALTGLQDDRSFVNDPWHSLGSLAGFTVTTGRYRQLNNGDVQLDIAISGSASHANNVSFSANLPASFQYPGSSTAVLMATNTPGDMTASGGPPRIVISGSSISVLSPANTTAGMWCLCTYPTM